jgi:hypothetical protein
LSPQSEEDHTRPPHYVEPNFVYGEPLWHIGRVMTK